MRISCVNACDQISGSPDIILFPERADEKDVMSAVKMFNQSIIIAAIVRNKKECWGELYKAGTIYCKYRKVKGDGFTIGSNDSQQAQPIFECSKMCVGVVVCLDVQLPLMRPCPENDPPMWRITHRIRSSPAELKLLCVPGAWKDPDEGPLRNPLGAEYQGLNVLFFNSPVGTIDSFISDRSGRYVAKYPPGKPFHLDLSDPVFAK